MSDRATLRRLLREHAEAVSTEIAFIKEDAILRLFDAVQGENNAEAAEVKAEKYEDALKQIDNWAKAYPLDIFPEPDFTRVREVLEAAGITLDSVSASNMRRVIQGVERIVAEATTGKPLKRRHVVKINLQADDWDSMLRALNNIIYDLSTYEPGKVRLTSGGPDYGYIVNDEYYPEQTHEHYFEEIEAYLEKTNKGGEE